MEPKKGLADPLERLERLVGLLRLVAGARIETGNLTTPDGTPYRGFKVSIGGVSDPSSVERTYADIEKILGRDKVSFKTHEETTPSGTFKSYSIEA